MWYGDYLPAVLAAASSLKQVVLHGAPALPPAQEPEIDYYARNLKTISTIYNLTVYPNNVPIISHGGSAVPAGLFSPNATGRVSPLGNFTGFTESIEYFFALALVPSPPSYSVFFSAKVVSFSSGCPEVAASVAWLETRVDHPNSTNDGEYLSTLKQVAFWRFDDEGAVSKYDAYIPNLADWDFIAEGQLNISDPFIQQLAIEDVCTLVQQRCVGSNQQYANVSQCVSTLSHKPFGNYDEVWADNVVCRTVHIILALVDPTIHCPHVGPTGGMKCVNEPYNEGYFDDEELFGAPVGEVFVCPDKKICRGW